MIRIFIILILLLIPILSFGQGKVTRPQKQAPHQSVVPKENDIKEPTFGTANGHDWVDLGLPSGTKWATCNVGASVPYDCGYYLSWGGLYIPKDEIYTRENAPLYGSSIKDISGNSSYDPARAKWGGKWRMPTKDEFIELTKHCDCRIGFVNGVKGCVITGKNGNTIFLPFNGVKSGSIKSNLALDVTIWLSTAESIEMAYLLVCGEEGFKTSSCNNKNVGYPVRPVLSK